MNRLRRVVSNTVISLIGQAVTWSSTLLLTVAYGRFLGDVKFGELYLALAVVTLIGFPLEFGFNQQLAREVSQDPSKAQSYFSNTLLVKALLWLLLYGCLFIILQFLGYNAEEHTLLMICGFTLLSTAITNTFASLHYAFERNVFPVIGIMLEKGLAAIIGFFLLKQGAGVVAMALVLFGGSFVNAIWQGIWFFRLVGTSFKIDLVFIREVVRTSIPFLIYGALGVIYYRLDTVLLSLMANAAVVGWYGAAYRLFDTMVFLPNLVIVTIMYPVFSKLSVTDESNLNVAIEKSMNFLLFCGIPLATLLIVAAPNIIGFLYHRAEFTNSVPALQALAPGIVFLYINTVLSTTLISTKQEKKITRMAAAALVFNLGLNFILIPRFQHVGAAIVTSLTELLLLCIAVVLIPRNLFPFGSLKVGAKALAASLAMALAILPLSNFNIFVILPIAMLVYLVVAFVLGTIPREDLKALYTAIRHKAHGASLDSSVEHRGAEPDLEMQEEDVEITEKLVRVNMNAVLEERTEKLARINMNTALEETDITEKLVRVKMNLVSPEGVP